MITISLFGGLGNQMFQYAAGKALAARHGVDLLLDLSGFRAERLRTFLLGHLRVPEANDPAMISDRSNYFYRARRRQRLDRLLALARLPLLQNSSQSYRQPHFHFDPNFLQLGPQTEMFGFFQSERYFHAIANDLRGYFGLREALCKSASHFAEAIAASSLPVSIHVRRGDYKNKPTARVHGILTKDYYQQAWAAIEHRTGGVQELFVFSDDQADAARTLDFLPSDRVTYVDAGTDRPWDEMYLMSRCRHHIIANSSFSWWGAWLNPAPDKIVVAPQAWFTDYGRSMHDVRDLYPDGWIRL